MLEFFGTLLVGLGLFVNGSNELSANLKALTSRRFRLTLTKYIARPWQAALIGILSSAVSQSTSVITFILAGLTSSGMITVRNALPIWSWGNIGSTVLVALAVLDLKLAILYLLGVASISVAFNRPVKYQRVFGALYGVGLLFFGIQLMKQGAGPLGQIEAFKTFIAFASQTYLVAFLIGAILRAFIQSSATVSIIAITLAQANLIDANHTAMIIFGTNIGSGVTVCLLSGNLKGTTRQIVWFQTIFDIFGGILFAILFYVEFYLHVPLVLGLAGHFSNSLARQMANVYIIEKFVVAAISAMSVSVIYRLLARLSPPTREEELAKLHFIHEHALDEPDIALDLIEKEQVRLFKRLPDYLHSARHEPMPAGTPDYHILNKAFTSISAEISSFLSDLMKSKEMDSEMSSRLLRLVDRNTLISSLEHNLCQFVPAAKTAGSLESLEPLIYNLVEGLDALQRAAVEALETGEPSEVDLLLLLTFDRSGLMEQMRKDCFDEGQVLNNEDRANFFYLISLFERGVWLLHKFGRTLKNNPDEGIISEPTWDELSVGESLAKTEQVNQD